MVAINTNPDMEVEINQRYAFCYLRLDKKQRAEVLDALSQFQISLLKKELELLSFAARAAEVVL